jgi:hypothetical protein
MRRCIVISVILGHFASQLAAVPHAHAGLSADERERHDAVPHFHCDWLGGGQHESDHGGHDHGQHDHGGHDHSHRGHKHHDEPAGVPQESTEQIPADGLGSCDHDATAICCPVHATRITVSQPQGDEALELAPLAAPIGGVLADCYLNGWTPDLGRPPDETLDGSNLYLTLRNLRI